MSRDDPEKRKFTDPENERKWGFGMAVVFVASMLLVPVFRLLGWV